MSGTELSEPLGSPLLHNRERLFTFFGSCLHALNCLLASTLYTELTGVTGVKPQSEVHKVKSQQGGHLPTSVCFMTTTVCGAYSVI